MCAFSILRENHDPMKNTLFLLVSAAWLTASVLDASAQELRVFADKAFQPALKEIKPLFIQQTG